MRDARHGFGTYWYRNGDKYEGRWYMNHKQGQGTLLFKNGDVYSGGWARSKRHGHGVFIRDKTYERYDGEYRDDKKHGYGAEVDANGVHYYGQFQFDHKHGSGITAGPRGELFADTWVDGNLKRRVAIERIIPFPPFKRRARSISTVSTDAGSPSSSPLSQGQYQIPPQHNGTVTGSRVPTHSPRPLPPPPLPPPSGVLQRIPEEDESDHVHEPPATGRPGGGQSANSYPSKVAPYPTLIHSAPGALYGPVLPEMTEPLCERSPSVLSKKWGGGAGGEGGYRTCVGVEEEATTAGSTVGHPSSQSCLSTGMNIKPGGSGSSCSQEGGSSERAGEDNSSTSSSTTHKRPLMMMRESDRAAIGAYDHCGITPEPTVAVSAHDWSVDDVSQYVRLLGLHDAALKCQEKGVDGEAFLNLSEHDLTDTLTMDSPSEIQLFLLGAHSVIKAETKRTAPKMTWSELSDHPTLRDYLLDPSEFETSRQTLGEGGFAKVLRADWRGKDVALKEFKPPMVDSRPCVGGGGGQCQADGKDGKGCGGAGGGGKLRSVDESKLCREYEDELQMLLGFRHPNILSCYGYTVDHHQHRNWVVTELVERGSLFDMLHRKRHKIDDYNLLKICQGLCSAFEYLHERGVIHGDLKSANVLLDRNLNPKLCDFGLAVKYDGPNSSAAKYRCRTGTPHWAAPECLQGHEVTGASDVYSFGSLLWEMLSRRVPYQDMGVAQVVGAVGWGRKTLPKLDEPQPLHLDEVIRACLDRDPRMRPSFTQLNLLFTWLLDCVERDAAVAASPLILDRQVRLVVSRAVKTHCEGNIHHYLRTHINPDHHMPGVYR
ncbi:unnamed protein product [Vitrella brassicaformis CCMP3155]|uniref:Protein kinase domain-containing protein n=1 Tax=Vitrella brassicaformis (strain CCMP3155) TaxID=1169540 RepID=A0A0G4FT64_VITBC|nr:unnamed protein product [Vitrella brassicaformis CCMP3155]|eukprot:CEM17547.1 unnamed protein product [Vitrella brassicaformis CCMP3155]